MWRQEFEKYQFLSEFKKLEEPCKIIINIENLKWNILDNPKNDCK